MKTVTVIIAGRQDHTRTRNKRDHPQLLENRPIRTDKTGSSVISFPSFDEVARVGRFPLTRIRSFNALRFGADNNILLLRVRNTRLHWPDSLGRHCWASRCFFFTTSAHPRPRFDGEVTTDRVSPRDLLLCSYLIRHIRGTPVLFAHIEDRDGKKEIPSFTSPRLPRQNQPPWCRGLSMVS